MEETIHDLIKDTHQMARLRQSLTLPNDINTIPQLYEFIEGIGEELNLDMSLTMGLNLALEEAVVNVMEYAYPVDVQGDVTIEAIANETHLVFILSDSGTPFDPTKKEKVDTTLSAEERSIGGLGIHLVREIMDSVDYEYCDNKNILTLSKKL
jgi:sigma-B regulation protein RsbU (phosphoserine phosphatase)